MARRLDQILVVDVEATCWEKAPPDGEESEIIEVGLCTVDIASGQRLEREDILVKPQRSRVSAFCTQLTTLTPEQVEAGISFPEVCGLITRKYLAKERVWASYGDYDRRQFEKQCQAWKISYPFGPTHINVKNLFAVIYARPYEAGMAEALRFLNLPLEGVHHRAGDDAWNIARILSELLLRRRNPDGPSKAAPSRSRS